MLLNIKDAIYVLHCFKKKSKAGISTPTKDVNLIKSRLKIVYESLERWFFMEKENIKILPSCGNVFADVEVEDRGQLQVKSTLAIVILQTIEKRGLTQGQAAKILGTHRTQLSRLSSGSLLDVVSIDKLISWLLRLGGDVTIKVKKPLKNYFEDGSLQIAL